MIGKDNRFPQTHLSISEELAGKVEGIESGKFS